MLWDIASFQNQFDLPKGDLSASLLFLAKIKEIVPQVELRDPKESPAH